MNNRLCRRDFLKLGGVFAVSLFAGNHMFDMVSLSTTDQGVKKLDNDLQVLTINCWGIPFAPNRTQRMAAIGKKLATGQYDIVGLQEVWFDQDWSVICQYAKSGGMDYTARFPSGVIGSGLGVISKYKIHDIDFKPYTVNGFPQNVHHGDYYGGKGIGLARIETPVGWADFYTTHLIARYSTDDQYLSHRVAQSVEVIKFMEETKRNEIAILTGDLNADSDTVEYKIVELIGGFADTFKSIAPSDPGYTVNKSNTYNSTGRERRIDFVFIKASMGKKVEVDSSQLDLKLIDDLGYSYSDHFGVRTSIRLSESTDPVSSQIDYRVEEARKTKQEALDLINAGIESAKFRRGLHVNKLIAGILSFPTGKIIARDILPSTMLGGIIDFAATYFSPLFTFSQMIYAGVTTNTEINGLQLVKEYLKNLPISSEE